MAMSRPPIATTDPSPTAATNTAEEGEEVGVIDRARDRISSGRSDNADDNRRDNVGKGVATQ